jgi:hypothetical protein
MREWTWGRASVPAHQDASLAAASWARTFLCRAFRTVEPKRERRNPGLVRLCGNGDAAGPVQCGFESHTGPVGRGPSPTGYHLHRLRRAVRCPARYSNWQRRRIQNPYSVGSNPTRATFHNPDTSNRRLPAETLGDGGFSLCDWTRPKATVGGCLRMHGGCGSGWRVRGEEDGRCPTF